MIGRLTILSPYAYSKDRYESMESSVHSHSSRTCYQTEISVSATDGEAKI